MNPEEIDNEIKEYTDKINELKKEKNKILIDELKNSLSIK